MANYDAVETIRAAANTTDSYVASDDFTLLPSHTRWVLEFRIVKDDATTFEYQIQGKDGDGNYHTLTTTAISSGTGSVKPYTGQITASDLAATDYLYDTFVRDAYAVYRVKVKHTGGSGSNSVRLRVRKFSGVA